MSFVERRAELDKLRPQQGFAVVGVDTYGSPDEQGLYPAGQFASYEEAYAAAADLKARSQESVFVLGPDGYHEAL